MLRRGQSVTAALEKSEPNKKDIEKAYKCVLSAALSIRKFQIALEANKMRKRVEDGTGYDATQLIMRLDKAAAKISDYAARLHNINII